MVSKEEDCTKQTRRKVGWLVVLCVLPLVVVFCIFMLGYYCGYLTCIQEDLVCIQEDMSEAQKGLENAGKELEDAGKELKNILQGDLAEAQKELEEAGREVKEARKKLEEFNAESVTDEEEFSIP